MDNPKVSIDTFIFIEYFRKENKTKTKLYLLAKNNYTLVAFAICYFEYMSGSKNKDFDKLLFENIEIISFDKTQAYISSSIFQDLKSKNSLIEFRDILISSCAISLNISLATLNKKHFERIKDLNIFEV